jgi:hypothetical protein
VSVFGLAEEQIWIVGSGVDACHEITHIGDSGIGGWKNKSFDFTSGEVARRSELSIEEDACQRSRDLANLEVRRVKAQTFGTPSREGARSEKRTTVGSARGIMHRSLVRKYPRNWLRGSRVGKVVRSRGPGPTVLPR